VEVLFCQSPVVLWTPLIQAGGSSFGVQSNQFGFNFTGPASLVIMVEDCINLASPVWIPLQTNTLTNGRKGQEELHVVALLPFVLPVKSLTINVVADVADFPELCIESAKV
jgi:hypothetical protein